MSQGYRTGLNEPCTYSCEVNSLHCSDYYTFLKKNWKFLLSLFLPLSPLCCRPPFTKTKTIFCSFKKNTWKALRFCGKKHWKYRLRHVRWKVPDRTWRRGTIMRRYKTKRWSRDYWRVGNLRIIWRSRRHGKVNEVKCCDLQDCFVGNREIVWKRIPLFRWVVHRITSFRPPYLPTGYFF